MGETVSYRPAKDVAHPVGPEALRPGTLKEPLTPGDEIFHPVPQKQKSKLNQQLSKLSNTQKKLIAVAAVALVLFAGYEIHYMLTTESTDDAFVTAHVHSLGARVAGTVSEVLVDDNQSVKKGDVLVRLDQRDFDVPLKIAEANFNNYHRYSSRWRELRKDDSTNDQLLASTDKTNANMGAAQLEQAQLNMSYTNIVAPVDGKIGKKSVETGQQVVPGQPLIALVEVNPWIVANFKENQFAKLRVGQPVKIKVDAIPDHSFTGKVESLSPGSGSTFALLPPDNATGNFTKIVQRIPVKIVFDPESAKGYEDRIASGMSTQVTVETK
jgi:membrane fusion protein (multidrug efflux system)